MELPEREAADQEGLIISDVTKQRFVHGTHAAAPYVTSISIASNVLLNAVFFSAKRASSAQSAACNQFTQTQEEGPRQ